MHKPIIFFLLFCFTSAFSQVSPGHSYCNNILVNSLEKENSVFKSSWAVNLSPSLFIPVNYGSEVRTGFGMQLGVQWNYKENTSLCLDFDLAYTVTPGYDYGFGIYRMSVSSKWNNYMILAAGFKFYFPLNEKLKLFCTPEIGALSSRKRANQSEVSPCLSFEFGAQYKLNNNFSAFVKLKSTAAFSVTGMGVTSGIGGFVLFNSGLSYQF